MATPAVRVAEKIQYFVFSSTVEEGQEDKMMKGFWVVNPVSAAPLPPYHAQQC